MLATFLVSNLLLNSLYSERERAFRWAKYLGSGVTYVITHASRPEGLANSNIFNDPTVCALENIIFQSRA